MTPKDNSAYEVRRQAADRVPGMRDQIKALPQNSRRRIQRIGIAATSVAATIWLVGAVWAWQVIG